MPAVLEELVADELKRQPDGAHVCEPWCAKDGVNAVADRIEKRLDASKARVADAFEDATRSAERLLKRGQHACEDALDETTHRVKKYPVPALGIAFAAGALLGALIPRRK